MKIELSSIVKRKLLKNAISFNRSSSTISISPLIGQVVRDLSPFCSLLHDKNSKHRSLYRFPTINACYSDNLRALYDGIRSVQLEIIPSRGLSGARLRSKKIIRVSMISAPCAPCSCICGRNVGKSCSRHPEICSPGEIALSHFYLNAYRVEFEALHARHRFIVNCAPCKS